MSNVAFLVPKLKDNGAWLDYRGQYPGGLGWRYDRALSKIRFAVNHHSVTNPTKNAKKDVDALWNIHKANGWGGIGYQFVITSEEVKGRDGLVYAKVAYVGDLGSVRAHTPNTKGAKGLKAGYGNEDLVAACMIGMLHQKNPTEAQIRSAYWLYRELITQEKTRMPNLAGTLSAKLASHKDFDPTACSGNWAWQKPQIVNYKDPPRIERKEEVRTVTIPFTSKMVEADDLPLGETKVIQNGSDGEKRVTWEVTYIGGKETSRKVKSEKTIRQPAEQITAHGTYVAPEPPTEPEVPETPQPPADNPIRVLIQSIIDWFVRLITGKEK
jgi:hypothetical protein